MVYLEVGRKRSSRCFHTSATTFIIEVSLSYLGFGVQEPNPSFGNMFKSHFDLILRGDFYTVFVIVGFMIITLAVPKIIFNLFSSVPYTFQIDRLKTR